MIKRIKEKLKHFAHASSRCKRVICNFFIAAAAQALNAHASRTGGDSEPMLKVTTTRRPSGDYPLFLLRVTFLFISYALRNATASRLKRIRRDSLLFSRIPPLYIVYVDFPTFAPWEERVINGPPPECKPI